MFFCIYKYYLDVPRNYEQSAITDTNSVESRVNCNSKNSTSAVRISATLPTECLNIFDNCVIHAKLLTIVSIKMPNNVSRLPTQYQLPTNRPCNQSFSCVRHNAWQSLHEVIYLDMQLFYSCRIKIKLLITKVLNYRIISDICQDSHHRDVTNFVCLVKLALQCPRNTGSWKSDPHLNTNT